jgi:hypothetical protein
MLWARRLCRTAAAATGVAVAAAATCGVAEGQSSQSVPKDAMHSSASLELLVHNISHADLYLLLKQQPIEEAPICGQSEGEGTLLARPQFNSFQPTSELILNHLDQLEAAHGAPEVISAPSKYKVHYPVGLGLTQHGTVPGAVVEAEDMPNVGSPWERFHLKGLKHTADGHPPTSTVPQISAVYLPLMAVLIPEWLRVLKRRETTDGTPPPRKVHCLPRVGDLITFMPTGHMLLIPRAARRV